MGCSHHGFNEGDQQGLNCSSCSFPPALAFPGCDHPYTVYSVCFRQRIEAQMETVGPENLSCPQCPNSLLHKQIRRLASEEVFKRYEIAPTRVRAYNANNRRFDVLALRRTLEHDPNLPWCLRSGCGSGQIHLNPTDSLMVCHLCKYQICFKHTVPWHTDFTCEEYDQRADIEEARSRDLLASLPIQKCPGAHCPYYLEKIAGCDAMRCKVPTPSLVLAYRALILVTRLSLPYRFLLGMSCYSVKRLLL